VDAECKQILTEEIIREIAELIPADWTNWTEDGDTPATIKETYYQFLSNRLNHSENFINEAQNARKTLI